MAYEYVPKKELRPYKEIVNKFFKSEIGKILLSKYNCFYRLVGSSKRNMVLRDVSKNDGFDLDYQIVFRKYYKYKSEEMIAIKDEFRLAMDKYLTNIGYKYGENSTTAITYKMIDGDKIKTGYDFVLLMPLEDGSFATFKYEDEEKKNMHLAKVKDSKDFQSKFKKIRGKDFNLLRVKYKYKKNYNIEHKKSFALLVECVNNVYLSRK